MENIFIQLAIILGISSVFGFLVRLWNLPLLIAYLLGGLTIALTAFFDVRGSNVLHFFPEIGVAFVVFLVGMELDLRELRTVGKPILITSILQVIITTILGSTLARSLGFGVAESWYLGVGLSFSSTIVVIKLLLDKKDLTALYGKLSLGILLLEDLLAVLILVVMTVSPSVLNLGYQQAFPLLALFAKAVILFVTALVLSKYVLQAVFRAVSASGELLFLTALAWCFIYISFSLMLGFSVVIGAFLAGVALASSPYHFQIQGKVKPLRDFFVALFFVYLGTQVNFKDFNQALPVMALFTGYALLVKPAIILLILGIFGFRKHTMFQTAVNLSQISEFSLIVILVGFETGLISSVALTAIALSTVLSMILSSIIITHANRIYKYLSYLVDFFEREHPNHLAESSGDGPLEKHVIVIGGHRVGGEVIKMLRKEGIPLIVLDFNPHQVSSLLKERVPVMYGDMGDPEVLDQLSLESARMIISTSQDFDDNRLLLDELKSRKSKAPVIVRAETTQEAKELYKAGADYVIIPEVLAGDFVADKLEGHFAGSHYFDDRSKLEMDRLLKKTLAWE